ncbi:MAG: protein translocase SEC61 complex subunit gamma [Candidatus Heimdallarchaeota archaeon]|nr:protein translocase SEC61 complex subunit gamma [Candidatus Heimdallarchaeota archaeon]MCK5048030.1 protein translocase SEC61 complex subunit gamma [Candidatus Heimdallarchaeota archaeon]
MNLQKLINQSKRILRLSKKPSRNEMSTTTKITALGLGVIGLIGYIIHYAMSFLVESLSGF